MIHATTRFQRLFTIVVLTFLSCVLMISELDRFIVRSVWAQAIQASIPLNNIQVGLAGNCTVLVPAVAGQRVYVQNGYVSIPAVGSGETVTFIMMTSNGANGTGCGTNVTQTTLGAFTGSQVGSTTTNNTIYPLNGIVTAQGQGIGASVTLATGAQPIGGFMSYIQQP